MSARISILIFSALCVFIGGALFSGCAFSGARNSGDSITFYNAMNGGTYISREPRYEKNILGATPIEIRWQINNSIGVGLGLEPVYITKLQQTPDNLSRESSIGASLLTVPFIYRMPISKNGVIDIVPRVSVDTKYFTTGSGVVKVGASAVVAALAWDYFSDKPRMHNAEPNPRMVIRDGIFFGVDAGFLMINENDKAPYIAAVLLGYEIGVGWRKKR